MNAGTVSDRLLRFCVAVVGRFRGGLGHVNVIGFEVHMATIMQTCKTHGLEAGEQIYARQE